MLAAERYGSERRPPVEVIAAALQYLPENESVSLEMRDRPEWGEPFERALGTLVSAARAGDFTADPRKEEFCRYCDFRDPCGEGRRSLLARKRRDPRVAARLALKDEDQGDSP